MYKDKKIVCFIPVRGGSKAVVKKNSKLLGGKPLLYYSIESSKKSKYIDDTYVLTEDSELKKIAEQLGVKVINLPEELTQDSSPSQDVVKYAFNFLGGKADFILQLQATSPFRGAETSDKAIEEFIENADDYDSLIPLKSEILKKGMIINKKYVCSISDSKELQRQFFKEEFIECGTVFMFKKELLDKDNIKGKNIYPFIIDSKIEAIDIDDDEDFFISEAIINYVPKSNYEIEISGRKIGQNHKPFIIAEIGINHEGSFDKAKRMVKDAYDSGADCVKFQMHIIEDEMTHEAKNVIPGNAKESIWDIMKRCRLKKEEHIALKKYCEELGIIYLCTPFSRAAANILENDIGVDAYKIGSGECNNYPLIEHIASFGKPIILSTGMNDFTSIKKSVEILEKSGVKYAILHCVSIYPTPYEKVGLNAIKEIQKEFPKAVVGLSDHSIGNYTCLGAVVMGASILEKHFTSDKSWPGPDIEISLDPLELRELSIGSYAIMQSMKGSKQILKEEKPTIDFAYACVTSIEDIEKGEVFSHENIWVKRPGTGDIKAESYKKILGMRAAKRIEKDVQFGWDDIEK